MRARSMTVVVAFAIACVGCSTTTSEPNQSSESSPAAWSYTGSTGPQYWGDLDEQYAACVDGDEQSPIDLTAGGIDGAQVELDYVTSPAEAEDTGHAEEMLPASAQVLTLDGVEFTLANVHVHMPSEHHLDGRAYPGEAHFVHQSADGAKVVVGRFLDEGADNPAWAPFIEAVGRTEPGTPVEIDEVDWAALAPPSAVLAYGGSLTTPPCSEGVRWFVGTDPILLGPDQLAELQEQYLGNNRPLQPQGDRSVGTAELAGT